MVIQLDALKQINKQIWREQVCVDDLMAEIKMHVQEGRINIAKQRERDLHNSLIQLEKLHERKRLRTTVDDLNQQGILARVVKKFAHQS